MNSAGLGVAINTLVTSADTGQPGIPFHVRIRALADCESLSDAVHTVSRHHRSSSGNYLLAHADGIAVNLETADFDEFARASGGLAAPPWQAVDKEYVFGGPGGNVGLLDLFDGRRQLILYRAFVEPGTDD